MKKDKKVKIKEYHVREWGNIGQGERERERERERGGRENVTMEGEVTMEKEVTMKEEVTMEKGVTMGEERRSHVP